MPRHSARHSHWRQSLLSRQPDGFYLPSPCAAATPVTCPPRRCAGRSGPSTLSQTQNLECGADADGARRTPASRDGRAASRSVAVGSAALFHQGSRARAAANQCAGESGGCAFEIRGAIVPAAACYECRVIENGKRPYAIARQDGRQIVFAGPWEDIRCRDGNVTRSFTVAAGSKMTRSFLLGER
jgi:hypothetical protein